MKLKNKKIKTPTPEQREANKKIAMSNSRIEDAAKLAIKGASVGPAKSGLAGISRLSKRVEKEGLHSGRVTVEPNRIWSGDELDEFVGTIEKDHEGKKSPKGVVVISAKGIGDNEAFPLSFIARQEVSVEHTEFPKGTTVSETRRSVDSDGKVKIERSIGGDVVYSHESDNSDLAKRVKDRAAGALIQHIRNDVADFAQQFDREASSAQNRAKPHGDV